MRIGTVTDLRTYRDYCPMFNELLGRPADAIELHLIPSDLDPEAEFLDEMEASAAFLRQSGVAALGHHYLDGVMNRILLLELYGSHPVYRALCPDGELPVEGAKLERLLRGSVLASHAFGAKVKAIIHEGVFFKSRSIQAFSPREVLEIRRIFLDGVRNVHEKYFAGFRDSVDIYLENSPPYAAAGTSTQHFVDQMITDIVERLRTPDRFVLDVSHWFMCCDYLRRGVAGVAGLDVFAGREVFKGDGAAGYDVLRSCLTTLGWVHLSDCTGPNYEHEGLPLFQDDSVIYWGHLLPLLKRVDAPLVLEIMGSERDFSRVEQSLFNLSERWGLADAEQVGGPSCLKS